MKLSISRGERIRRNLGDLVLSLAAVLFLWSWYRGHPASLAELLLIVGILLFWSAAVVGREHDRVMMVQRKQCDEACSDQD